MAAADYILFLGIVGGGLLVALLPALIALMVARFSSLPRRYLFALICAVLTYGATVAALVVQAPLLAASTHLAPTWASLGHHSLANAIAYSAEWLGYATVLVPLVLTVVCPLWLRLRWAALLVAAGANNSFKPNPLRGSA